jgi:putative transposase
MWVKDAWEYPWSSAKYHTGLIPKDVLLKSRHLRYSTEEWKTMLKGEPEQMGFLRKRSRTGRPCGDINFVRKCENVSGKSLHPKKPGPKIDIN